MTSNRPIWFDLGYSTIKTDKFKMPSVVGNGRKIRYTTGMGHRGKLDTLDVQYEGTSYFVGEMAKKQSDQVILTLDEDRYKALETNVLMETVLALLTKDNESVDVVTGLPLDYLKYQNDLKERLENHHEISLSGRMHRSYVETATVIPQPLAVFFDAVLGEDGKIRNKKLAKARVGIVDIGFGTTDIAIIDSMDFIDKYSKSKDIAMNSIYKLIAEEIFDQFSVDKDMHELEREVMAKSLKINGKQYLIDSLIEAKKDIIARKLVNWILTIWKDRENIDAVVIAGGGGIALDQYVSPLLGGVLVEDAQYSILRGYRKLARRVYKND